MKEQSLNLFWSNTIATVISVVLLGLLSHPFDTLKTLMQGDNGKGLNKKDVITKETFTRGKW